MVEDVVWEAEEAEVVGTVAREEDGVEGGDGGERGGGVDGRDGGERGEADLETKRGPKRHIF